MIFLPLPSSLALSEKERAELWRFLQGEIESYAAHVDQVRVAPRLDPVALRGVLDSFDFLEPRAPLDAAAFAAENLWRQQVHTPHPRYFGLFNPAPTSMGILADGLVAAFNPQMAAWSHNPFACEVEQHLVRAFGKKFGYAPEDTDGVFTSGGAEANHTALLCALTHSFAEFAAGGTRALPKSPVLYVSSQTHHSILKAARLCGLGSFGVHEVPLDAKWRLDPAALDAAVVRDRTEGSAPFFVVATAGTTGAGLIDNIDQLAAVARKHSLWLHVDAAWGGAAAMVPELRPLLRGVETAQSITFDAHKFLSVPMGAGMFITRHPDILRRTFSVAAGYMPLDAAGLEIDDPYAHSMQWSRRFIGLKVFLSLAVAGWAGYADAIRHQVEMGELLRRQLTAADWQVVNPTLLPVVCFYGRGCDPVALAARVVDSGQAWISTVRLPDGNTALRACITNYRTGPDDVRALVDALEFHLSPKT